MLEIGANQSAEMRRAIFAERLVEMFQAGGKDAAFDPVAQLCSIRATLADGDFLAGGSGDDDYRHLYFFDRIYDVQREKRTRGRGCAARYSFASSSNL